MTFHLNTKSDDSASAQRLRCSQPKNLDDTIWGALVAYGFMGALCAFVLFGLVAA